MNYVRQTDFSEVSRFHLSHNKLWRKLNRLRSEKYGSLKACILRDHGYIYWEIRHFEMIDLSVNGLYRIKLKGKGRFDWAKGKELLVKGHQGLIKLRVQNKDWYWHGDVSEYSIPAIP